MVFRAHSSNQVDLQSHKENINMSGGDAQVFAFLITVAGVVSAIFWMVVGWRAMRAHERIADAAEQTARKLREGGQ